MHKLRNRKIWVYIKGNKRGLVLLAAIIIICSYSFRGLIGADRREITITAVKYQFIPNEIKLRKGEEVQLNILAEDVTHGFCCKELGIYLELPAGEEVEYILKVDKVGEYEFYCCVYCGVGHKKMKGRIIVSE